MLGLLYPASHWMYSLYDFSAFLSVLDPLSPDRDCILS